MSALCCVLPQYMQKIQGPRFFCSFGKQPHNRKRGTDCLVLEYSELIVVGLV